MIPHPRAPRFEFVDVQPHAGVLGAEVVVTWSACHADEVVVEDYGVFPPSGSVPVVLEVTRSLRLTARGPAGPPAEARTPVMHVFNPPVISFLGIPSPPDGLDVSRPSAHPGIRDEFTAVLTRAPRGPAPSPATSLPDGHGWLGFTRTGDFSTGRAGGQAPFTGWGTVSPLLARVGYPQFPLAVSRMVGTRRPGGGRDPGRSREAGWRRVTARLRRPERLS